jgi:hypothetical protein
MHKIIPQKTLSDAERKLLSLEARKNAVLNTLLDVVTKTFDAVWDDPVEMLAAQGTQAEANFQDHARTVIFLIRSGVDVPVKYQAAPQAYTIHSDGTITLD